MLKLNPSMSLVEKPILERQQEASFFMPQNDFQDIVTTTGAFLEQFGQLFNHQGSGIIYQQVEDLIDRSLTYRQVRTIIFDGSQENGIWQVADTGKDGSIVSQLEVSDSRLRLREFNFDNQRRLFTFLEHDDHHGIVEFWHIVKGYISSDIFRDQVDLIMHKKNDVQAELDDFLKNRKLKVAIYAGDNSLKEYVFNIDQSSDFYAAHLKVLEDRARSVGFTTLLAYRPH
jgi:glycogen debranching enzyme